MKSRERKNKSGAIGTDRDVSLTVEDISELEHGVQLFNSGRFRQAHEAWELVWSRATDDGKTFLHGLVHLAAAYQHMAKGEGARGFVNDLREAGEKLRGFSPRYLGVEVSSLLEAVETGIAAARRNGETDFPDFGSSPAPKIVVHVQYHPDLSASIRTVLDSEEFAEGVGLFNGGYHWEAHERWEDAARRSDADGKSFLEGFIQAAGGINFLRSGKMETAAYLLSKAAENLGKYDDLDAGVDFDDLLSWISSLVATDLAGRPTAVVKRPLDPIPALRLLSD